MTRKFRIDATFLSMALGLFTAFMVIWFSYNLWFNPHHFVEKFAPPLQHVDYGSLIRARWIANRILPYGMVMLACVALKQYRFVGLLLVMRFGVDMFDGFVLTLSLLNGVRGNSTTTVMIGAYALGVFCLLAGVHLLRVPEEKLRARRAGPTTELR